jgi:hypothetical protein
VHLAGKDNDSADVWAHTHHECLAGAMRCEPPGAPMPILNQEHLDPLIIAEAVFADPPLMNQVAFKSMSHAAIPP